LKQAHSRLTVHAPESGVSVAFRNTLIYTLEDAVWRLVHVHNSNPRPNIDTMGYVTCRLDELLTAAQSAPLDLGQTGIASIMFTDIVDSTALAAAVGDATWQGLVRGHLSAVEEYVTVQGGTLVKSLGDRTMSTFPSARSALTAAQEIQTMMAEQASEPHLQVRIGIHTGDLVADQADVFGSVVNKAARIDASAQPTETRLSDATRIMIGGVTDFQFSEPLSLSLKGLDGTHTVYRLIQDDRF